MKFGWSIGNEEGSVLVISVVILALLTVIGIAATSTTSIELQIASNDRIYKDNFYHAEGAAMMLARVLENMSETTDPSGIDNLKADQPTFTIQSEQGDVVDLTDEQVESIGEPSYWDNLSCEVPGFGADNAPEVILRGEGIAAGSSLGMTEGTNLYQYAIFGRQVQESNNRGIVVAIGYRKRY
jgi:hypothetical protein